MGNPEGCNSTGQALGLFPRSHQLESRTSGPVGLVEMRAS
jgi:hypothetical protein